MTARSKKKPGPNDAPDGDGAERNDVGNDDNPVAAGAVIEDSSFWAYVALTVHVGRLVESLNEWFQTCPCHCSKTLAKAEQRRRIGTPFTLK